MCRIDQGAGPPSSSSSSSPAPTHGARRDINDKRHGGHSRSGRCRRSAPSVRESATGRCRWSRPSSCKPATCRCRCCRRWPGSPAPSLSSRSVTDRVQPQTPGDDRGGPAARRRVGQRPDRRRLRGCSRPLVRGRDRARRRWPGSPPATFHLKPWFPQIGSLHCGPVGDHVLDANTLSPLARGLLASTVGLPSAILVDALGFLFSGPGWRRLRTPPHL